MEKHAHLATACPSCPSPLCRDHLDLMFGPEAPPLEWDAQRQYGRGSIEVYYLSHAATPLSLDQLTEARGGALGGGAVGPGARGGWDGAQTRARLQHVGTFVRGSVVNVHPPLGSLPASALPTSYGWPTCPPKAPPPLPPPPQAFFGSWPEVQEEGPRRYGPNAATWVRVQEGWTLRDALCRPDHIIPGVPAFFVLARGTDFRDAFLQGDLPLL